jgi:predicted membrane protein
VAPSNWFWICLGIATLVAFFRFAAAEHNRAGAFFTALANFPFWAVVVIYTICAIYTAITSSYAYRLQRTLHLNHTLPRVFDNQRRPSRPAVNTDVFVTERDITSATPNSANYFRHV